MPGNVVHLLVTLLQLYSFVVLARVVVSWIPNVPRDNPIVQLIHRLTEPVLEPVRRAIPPLGMMDVSPLVVFVGLHILQRVILSLSRGM